jgi:hypothetical protein
VTDGLASREPGSLPGGRHRRSSGSVWEGRVSFKRFGHGNPPRRSGLSPVLRRLAGALPFGPEQCAVDGEMLVRQQVRSRLVRQERRKAFACDGGHEQCRSSCDTVGT